MNIATITHNLDTFLESLFFGAPITKGPGLPDPPVKVVAKQPAPKTEIKYTAKDGLPYIEEKPAGNEVSVWNMITTETAKSAGRSKLGTSDEIAAGIAKGFSAETVALVRLHWTDGKTQAAIAKAAGLSLDTVKKITPIFSKKGK